MTKYGVITDSSYEIVIATTDTSLKNDKYRVVLCKTEQDILNSFNTSKILVEFPSIEAAEQGIPDLKTKAFVKEHVSISAMANSLIVDSFRDYADDTIPGEQKWKDIRYELERCEDLYLQLDKFTFSADVVAKAVEVFKLFDQRDKVVTISLLRKYWLIEPNAPFVVVYNAIKDIN